MEQHSWDIGLMFHKVVPQDLVKALLPDAWLAEHKHQNNNQKPSGSRCQYQGLFLWTLRVCTLGFWVPTPWNMALNKGIWDPKLRGTNIKGTNLKSLTIARYLRVLQ